jgi:hypothetical protein
MKKQILAAAVAATLAVPAMADISITGNAKFEYTYADNNLKGAYGGAFGNLHSGLANTGTATVNGTETEINLNVRGKAGDTKVVVDLEIDSHGDTEDGALDIEDTYMTTKVGPVGVKAGNYASGTSGLLGEIENGDRADDKFTLDYTTNGIQFYLGNSGTKGDDTTINNNMFAGVKATVEGWTLQAKKNNENKNSFGVAGQAGPVGIRFEYADSDDIGTDNDTKQKDTGYFLNLTGSFDNINVGLATVQMDGDGGITEDDSSVFALSNDATGNSNTQLSANTTVDGTTYAAFIGQIGFEANGVKDVDYYAIAAIRPLASGAKLTASYANADWDDNGDASVFEIDLSVKF